MVCDVHNTNVFPRGLHVPLSIVGLSLGILTGKPSPGRSILAWTVTAAIISMSWRSAQMTGMWRKTCCVGLPHIGAGGLVYNRA